MLKRKNNLTIFLITSLLCLALILFAFSIQTFAYHLADQSIVRAFLDDNINKQQILEKLNRVEGVIKTNYISKDKIAMEFEDNFGYTWNGTVPLPDLVDISVFPADAGQVVKTVENIKGIEYVAYEANIINKLAWLTSALSWFSGIVFLLAISATTVGSFVIIKGRKTRCGI